MADSYLSSFCQSRGLSSRHLAMLLNQPISGISMAAAGKRALKANVQMFLNEMEHLPPPLVAAESQPLSIMETKLAGKQIRLLQHRCTKLQMQLEPLEQRLQQTKLRMQWLPQMLEHPAIETDELRSLSANLLLRQTREAQQQLRINFAKLTAQLKATEAELAYWSGLSIEI